MKYLNSTFPFLFIQAGLLRQTKAANKVDTLEEGCHRLQDKMTEYLEYNNTNIKNIKDQVWKTPKFSL